MLGAWLDAYFRNGHIWCLYIFFLISGNVVTLGLVNLLGDRGDGSWELCKPGVDLPTGILLLGQHSAQGLTQLSDCWGAEHKGGEEMFDTRCSSNKTDAPNRFPTGWVLLSDVQPLHSSLVGEVPFLPFSQLFSELFRLMSWDTFSWCSLPHLCVFRTFYSKIP